MVRQNMMNRNGRVQFGVQSVKSLPMTFPLIVALLVLGMFAAPVSALNVNGMLAGGTWRVGDSPYIVTGDIELGALDSLRIEPGVRVEFAGPYVFVVHGWLSAIGTKDDMVTFTSVAGSPDSMRWGGIRFVEASNGCKLSFVRITNGWARGAWPRNCGGGIYAESCNPTITRSEIFGNRADADGGAYFSWFANASITNVLFHSNYARNFGGALFFSYSSPEIINCTIALDTAGAWGGGIFAGAESRPTIVNSIVTHNVHQLWGGDLGPGDNYTRDLGRAQSARASVSFSNVGMVPLSPFPGSGNIYLDPEFMSLVPPLDFHLSTFSPDVDGGDPKYNATAEPDQLVNRIDVGAYGGTEEATLSVPVVRVNFNALNFGNFRLNAATPKEIKIENRGHYRLIISDFQFSNRAFYTDSTEGDSGLIPSYLAAPIEPGESAKYTIFFRPNDIRAYQETLTIVTNDSITQVPVLTLNGTGIDPVAVMVDSLTFERTAIGSERTKSVWVKNTGRSNLTLERNPIQGDAFSAIVVDANIARGDSGEVQFTFSPSLPESYSVSAGFDTNDRDLFIYLLGRGYGPKLVLPDTSMRFLGYVYVNGDTAVSSIAIRNEGDENLVINSAQVADTVAFSTLLPNGGLVIAPGSTGELVIRFHPPIANQVRNSRVTISSNYPESQVVRLSGRGMAEPGRYVFGHVSGVWDWFDGHDDYIVLDSVYVPINQRLKIEAGARILFEPGAAFIAEGEVRAVGTPTDSIYFLPRDNSGSQAARWKGIELSVVDASRLSYCSIKSSRTGLVISEASPRIEFSTITNNGDSTTTARGTSRGGALRIENSGAEIISCLIEGNRAALGGGAYIVNSKPTIANCTIRNNSANDGAAIYVKFLTGGLYQSLIIDHNTAPNGFSTITVSDRSAPRIVNCTIADNSGIGIKVTDSSLPAVINSIIWGNTEPFDLQDQSNALVTYSDYPGDAVVNKNLAVNPGFVGTGAMPYQLASNSPLLDKGNPESAYRDFFFPPAQMTSRNDIGAYGGPLGGGWGMTDISINLFQNPAFPRWCDVIVSSEEGFTSAPVCSVEFSSGPMRSVTLGQIDGSAYRGSIEVPEEGTIFLTSNGQVGAGSSMKVGRTFEVKLANTSDGTIYLADLGGELILPGHQNSQNRLVMATVGESSIKPEPAFLPASGSTLISGLSGKALIKIPTFASALAEVKGLSLYQRNGIGWQIVAGHYEQGWLNAEIEGDGEYVLAIGDERSSSPIVPLSAELIEAFPNPFNGGVTIAFDLSETRNVTLTVHDLSGRQIETLTAGNFKAGRHEVHWDAGVSGGSPLPSGIYWAKLTSGQGVRSIKLLLVR